MKQDAVITTSTAKNNKSNGENGWKIVAIMALIVAICGLGVGVYALIDVRVSVDELKGQLANGEKKSNNSSNANKGVSRGTNKNVDKDANRGSDTNKDNDTITTESLVKPYLGILHDSLLFDIFDLWSYKKTDLYVAYLNAKKENSIVGDTIKYSLLEQKYKYLFGSNKTLEKADQEDGFHAFYYQNNNEGGVFRVKNTGGGGTGDLLISVVKSTRRDGNSIVVEVYHGHPVKCSDVVKKNCTNTKLQGYYTEMNSDIQKIVNVKGITVYKMNFLKDGDHYVLDSITR